MPLVTINTHKLLREQNVFLQERPSQENVVEWFRKKHKLYISAGPSHYSKFGYELSLFCKKPYRGYFNVGRSSNYKMKSFKHALEEGIKSSINVIYGNDR
jgi:hypothetical protein